MSELERFARFCSGLVLEDGEKMLLEDWQRTAFAAYFDGVPESLVIVPKKNGKSSGCAALALWHVLTTPDADCVIVAASREQASLVSEQCAGIVRRTKALRGALRPMGVGREVRGIGKFAGRRLKVLASDANTADGQRPTLAIVDELHRHRTSQLYSVLRDGLPARDGRMVTISTAGEFENPDEDDPHADPLARLRLAARALPLATPYPQWRYVEARTEQFYYGEWSLWDGDDYENFELVKACNPASWITVEALRQQYESQSMQLWQWLRFKCGRWVSGGEDGVISAVDWHACANPEVGIPRGAHVFVGLDCARVYDTTAVCPVWASPSRDRIITCDAVVLRPPGGGAQLPVSEIAPTIVEMAARWSITVVYDPAAAGGLVAEELDRLGIDAVEFPQSPQGLAAASERLRALIVERKLTHDANPAVTSHVLAAVQRSVGAEGWRIAKPRRGGRHVDAAVALAMAAHVALESPAPVNAPELETAIERWFA